MVLHNFIVFEGIDGAGTSTQLALLKKKKETKSQLANFLFTAEPTPTATGKFLRQMLKGDVKVTNETAAYLFAADRNEHINGEIETDGDTILKGVKKACESGKIVLSDRYLFSSLAYQSINCPREVPRIVNSLFPMPEIVFFFDIEPKISLSRIGERETREIYEKEDFLNLVSNEYKSVIAECKEKEREMQVVYIDATQPISHIEESIWKIIEKLL